MREEQWGFRRAQCPKSGEPGLSFIDTRPNTHLVISLHETMADTFPLFALPTELRIRVYEHVFDLRDDSARRLYHEERYGQFDLDKYPTGVCKLDLSARGTIKSCSLGEARLRTSPLRRLTAILQTSKQVQNEATEVLYAQTCFRIVCGASHSTGSRLLCASRSACFNFRSTNIYDRVMVQLLRQVQNAELSMRFEREGQILDLLPAVDVVLSILNLSPKRKRRSFCVTLTEWLPICLDTIDPWTWRDIIDALRALTFGCRPVIEARPIPAEGSEKHRRLRELTDAAGGVTFGESAAT